MIFLLCFILCISNLYLSLTEVKDGLLLDCYKPQITFLRELRAREALWYVIGGKERAPHQTQCCAV